MKRLVILICVLLSGMIAQVQAQEFNVEAIRQKMEGLLGNTDEAKRVAGALSSLEKAVSSFTPQEAERIRRALRKGLKSAGEAEQHFDKLLKQLRDTQSLGDPGGEFVRLMNSARSAALERAEKAEARNTKISLRLAESFRRSAELFEEIRNRAIKARNDAIPALTYIESQKADYADAIAAREFAIMAEIADGAVKKVEEQSRAIRKTASDMQRALGAGATD